MAQELSQFAARLREFIRFVAGDSADRSRRREQADLTPDWTGPPPHVGGYEDEFGSLALELFALQFVHNDSYRRLCEARGVSPRDVEHWSRIPAMPTAAFKELEVTCLPPQERQTVFHSSGTTEQRPSRHFHSAESLTVYEASLWAGLPDLRFPIFDLRGRCGIDLVLLTPPPEEAPHSSLVYMFETVRRNWDAPASCYFGSLTKDGGWEVDFDRTHARLRDATAGGRPLILCGTAFSFVHLLDHLTDRGTAVQLPAGSRVMETGGYKGRSRSLQKQELHALITRQLGVPRSHIVCEYGMSELSSQAYDGNVQYEGGGMQSGDRRFRFPPWARALIISPETGRDIAEGETGLIRVFDLANVFSVMAVQTEDLGVRRADGFELIGRAELAAPRGCSLMAG